MTGHPLRDLWHDRARVESSRIDIHRQMDTQGSVLASRRAPPPWGAASPCPRRFPAHAHKNATKSRIHGIGQQTGNEIEDRCRRVFPDKTWKDTHRSAQWDVRLGKSIRPVCGCRRAHSAIGHRRSRSASVRRPGQKGPEARTRLTGLIRPGTAMFLIAQRRRDWQPEMPGCAGNGARVWA